MELTKKERRKIIAFDIALIIIILGGVALATHIYNKTAGTTCESNFDCKFHCPAGSFNENFINIYKSPFGASDCSEGLTPVCENNKCKTYDAYGAVSIEECERIGGGFYEFICYLSMAKKHGNATYCDKIPYNFDRSYCYFELARTSDDLSLCGGVTDADLKETCARELIEVPHDYQREPPYSGDCAERPQYTVCLTFSDGYMWFVYDEILDTDMQEGEGHTIEIGRGKEADYYHILNTDFVKEVGN